VSAAHTSCHGTFECLRTCSRQWRPSSLFRVYQKFRSYLMWHVENMGLGGMVRHALSLGTRPYGRPGGTVQVATRQRDMQQVQEKLELQPGELVEVKSLEEILATLDGNRRNNGLLWMTGMSRYCGQRHRVRRRVERIMLESNGELRNMRNTVLLEGVMCDGAAFGGCDRSCFHFWREVWLKRVPQEERDHRVCRKPYDIGEAQ
jgi:hypothetical protein